MVNRVLFTGGSSAIGERLLTRLFASATETEFWCVRHREDLAIADSHTRVIDLDLSSDFDLDFLPQPLGLVIHCAAVTHAYDASSYWNINFHGTMRLARQAHARGCRRFVYISTRCAVMGSGAYGESKLAAEKELKRIRWDDLLIIRPSEIYGGGGTEGVDRLVELGQRWHLSPWLFGNSNIVFSPLHVEDFTDIVAQEIGKPPGGLRVIDVCGPEDLSAYEVAARIAKRYGALQIPVWWPLFAFGLRIGARFNSQFAVPDQLERLECVKTSSAHANTIGRRRFLVE